MLEKLLTRHKGQGHGLLCLGVAIYCGLCFSPIGEAQANGNTQTKPVERVEQRAESQRLLDIAAKQVGVRERTGNNDGREVEAYLGSVGLQRGDPWCAAFLYWVHREAGVKAPRSGYCPDWFDKGRNVDRRFARGGDVAGIWFPSKGRVAHIVMIKDVEYKDWAVTYEGNTNDAGSREGDGVYRKRRPMRSLYIFARYWKD